MILITKGAKDEVNLTFNDICREQIPSNVTDCANFGREGDK